jgi:protein-L-isoaspartate O-methyltransferase
LAQGKHVLDIACGEGYGANLLARVASKVTGVDVDGSTIEHAKGKYHHPQS